MNTGVNHHMTEVNLKQLILDALEKSLFGTAITLSELLCKISTNSTASIILHAKCFYTNGEPRRALSILERNGILSSDILHILRNSINPPLGTLINDNDIEHIDESIDAKFLLDHLNGVYLGGLSLFLMSQFEDCISLLQPLVLLDGGDSVNGLLRNRIKAELKVEDDGRISVVASIYCLIGKCFFNIENMGKSLSAFLMALKVDLVCVESALYIVDNNMLSEDEMAALCHDLISTVEDDSKKPFVTLYHQLLHKSSIQQQIDTLSNESNLMILQDVSVSRLVVSAEQSFSRRHFVSCYRLAKYAHSVDPLDSRGLNVYVAALVELRQLTELYYLAHELVNSSPKMALSWYAVGCYYWCCQKLDLARSFFHKSCKLDKRFAKAWVIQGHVLAAQEESEQAVSAYRTAVRLLPGDHRPMVYMAQELLRTNYATLALQVLLAASKYSSADPLLFNEIGVAHLKLGNTDLSLQAFEKAVYLTLGSTDGSASCQFANDSGKEIELLCNYATALRRVGRLEDALHWFGRSLALSPNDAGCHADLGFTHHLLRRFDEAVASYHAALAIRPNSPLFSELLHAVMEDLAMYQQ